MQHEEGCRRNHSERGINDPNSVVSIVFSIILKQLTELHGSKYELLDCQCGETASVKCHELFIGQDVIDLEQLIADALHREAIDDSDGPHTEIPKQLI